MYDKAFSKQVRKMPRTKKDEDLIFCRDVFFLIIIENKCKIVLRVLSKKGFIYDKNIQ